MSDVVRIVIAGTELTGWEGVSLDMAAGHIADGFSVDGPWDWARKQLREIVKPFGYQRVELYINDDPYLTGRLDKIAPKVGDADRMIQLEGRSLTGVLADCSIRGDLEFSGLTLAQTARKVCKPFGIAVRADADTAAIAEVRAEYGQGAGDFLSTLAAPRNMLLNCSYKGELVISSGADLARRQPFARLIEGKYPVVSVEAEYDATKRFSYHEVASQFAGIPDIVGSCTDSGVSVYRPRLVAAGETDTDPGVTAARSRAASLIEAAAVSIVVIGWRRPDGGRWAERQIVTVHAPSAMVYRESPMLIDGVRLQLDTSGGRMTTLRLVLPEAYSGQAPKVLPWAS